MRLNTIIIFIISILLPTALLSYFGFSAVRSEKDIVEKNMHERYKAIADIVENEIKLKLDNMPDGLLKNKKYLESVLIGASSIFKDQVKIFDKDARAIGGPERSFYSDVKVQSLDMSVLTRPIKSLPYNISVYERHPLIVQRFEQKRAGLNLYIMLIVFSALLILLGGFFTLLALSREWRLAELKTEFVSVLSHDLRKPLTSIKMFSEMLKDYRFQNEEKKKDYCNIINIASERLMQLANNVLDFSRIERGRKKYDFKTTNLSNIVTDTVHHFNAYIMEGDRSVELKMEDSLPLMALDSSSISQALMNLLTNALKFSPPDKAIKVNLINRNNKEAVIEVIDQGVGVPHKEHRKIFQKFYRVSKKEVKDTEGAGLGLMLVKCIARAHKGRIEVESEVGKGSRFSIILPVS